MATGTDSAAENKEYKCIGMGAYGMRIRKVVIQNFRSLKNTRIDLNPHLNIIVGDNETGKSTLLEAIHLVMSGQIIGRGIQSELTPYLFNHETKNAYLASLRSGETPQPPSVLIEAYFEDDDALARLKGSINSAREDCPGLALRIKFNDQYSDEYAEYIRTPEECTTIPIEYYEVEWHSFGGNAVTARTVPLKSTLIDTSGYRATSGTERYINKNISEALEPKHRVELSLSYRKLKDVFQDYENVKRINTYLATKKGNVTDKELSVAMDMSSRSGWETGLAAHLDNIPLSLSGKGEQSTVNMKLAIETSGSSHILLIEEPENHLSYPNVNKLIGEISRKAAEKQIIIATHSSFVLNKLGAGNVILFNRNNSMKLDGLSADTKDYFMKLPGHDTLRLILAKKAILVEGPSDELIVQKAFFKKHGAMPLDKGVDVISVQSLAFKRFLEIARLLQLRIAVVTDNDGSVMSLQDKYRDYWRVENIQIYHDDDENFPTLEPQMLKANSRELLNRILGKETDTDSELLEYMKNNKTDCALKIFNSAEEVEFPKYIENAIS